MTKLKLFRVFYLRNGRRRSQTFAVVPHNNMADEATARMVAHSARGNFISYEAVVQHGEQQELFLGRPTTQKRIDDSLLALMYCGIGIVLTVVAVTTYLLTSAILRGDFKWPLS